MQEFEKGRIHCREQISAQALAQEEQLAQFKDSVEELFVKRLDQLETTLLTPLKESNRALYTPGNRVVPSNFVGFDDGSYSRESLSTAHSSRASASVPLTKHNRIADAHKEEKKKNVDLEQKLKSAEAENIQLKDQLGLYGSSKKPLPKPRKQKLSKKTEKSIATHKENISNGIESKAKTLPALDDVNQTVANPGGLRRSTRNLGR